MVVNASLHLHHLLKRAQAAPIDALLTGMGAAMQAAPTTAMQAAPTAMAAMQAAPTTAMQAAPTAMAAMQAAPTTAMQAAPTASLLPSAPPSLQATMPAGDLYDAAADPAGVGRILGGAPAPAAAPTAPAVPAVPATPAAPRPATVDDMAGSIGADVTRPFQPGAGPAGPAPAAATAPATPVRQSNPVGTGVGAATVTQVSQWVPGNLSGRPYGQHAALPGMNQRNFPTIGGRQFYQSDLGTPTGTETMNPNGANHNWWGWGNSAEQAGRNLTAANTHGAHNIALGKGGVQHSTNGGSQFFNSQGVETGAKTVDPSTGKATLHSMYGGGSVGPDVRRGIDWSRGSVKDENGMPWKPAAPGQKEQPQQFAQRMAENAPGIVPSAGAAPAAPSRQTTVVPSAGAAPAAPSRQTTVVDTPGGRMRRPLYDSEVKTMQTGGKVPGVLDTPAASASYANATARADAAVKPLGPAPAAATNSPGGKWTPPEHRTGNEYRPATPNPASVKV